MVVTEVFANLAATAARARGYSTLRTLVLPHPMESRPEADVRAIARAHFRRLMAALADDV